MQGLGGEAGEVNVDFIRLECALDASAESDRFRSAFVLRRERS